MTDKQIIIDGVDVSGCEHLYREIDCSAYIDFSECCEGYDHSYGYCPNIDCYYKQLKRAENQIVDLNKMVEAKEQKCEELVSKGNQLDKKCKQQSWDIGNLGYKIKNQRHEINNRLKQLDQLKVENARNREKLQAKEQECEELKDEILHLRKEGNKSCAYCIDLIEKEKQLDQLKAENEQLKEELSTIQHNCNREGCKYYDDDTFKVFYECKAQKALQLSANSVTTKYCDLLQTLTEIEKLAIQGNVYCVDYNVDDCEKCIKQSDCKTTLFKQILQKISEVENG